MPSIETKHITIDRRVRYATLGQPSEAVREVWFVLHGYSQLAPRFLRHRQRPWAGKAKAMLRELERAG